MSGLAGLEAQLRQHRTAYLAGAAGVVVLVALRARSAAAKSAPVPTTKYTGNPAGPYDGTLAPAVGGAIDLSPLQLQLAGISQQLTDYALLGQPAPTTVVKAPLGGGSTTDTSATYQQPAPSPTLTQLFASQAATAGDVGTATYIYNGQPYTVDSSYAEANATDLAYATDPYLAPELRQAAITRLGSTA